MNLRRQRVIILDRGQPIQITCSKCGERKEIDEFGLRQMPNGDIRNQPRCRSCRAGTRGSKERQLPLAFRRIAKAGLPLPLQLIVARLKERTRNQTETPIERLAKQARVSYKDALRFARRVQKDGAGKLVVGRRGRPTRIVWTTPLTEYVGSIGA